MLQPSGSGINSGSAIIGLGSNLASDHGSPMDILQAALGLLAQDGVEIQSVSRFYATPCFPAGAGPDYVNAAALLRTTLAPKDLLSTLHDVEEALGRTRIARWGQRTVDLDLLAFGGEILPDQKAFEHWLKLPIEAQSTRAPEHMILPHPRLQDRAFVLVPMADVAPDWVHPVLQCSTRQMLDDLDADEVAQIKPL